jgi:ABC-type uncharacterized transport system substrate-binding protein
VRKAIKKNIFGFVLCAILLALSSSVEAQQAKVYRVGVLLPGEAWYEMIEGLRVGLKQLGLEEGNQFVLAIRDWKGETKAAEEAARKFEQEKST